MHPGERNQYASEDDFEVTILRDHPDRWFDPLEQGLVIDRNLYWAAEGQKLVLYGCPWRARHKEFADLISFAAATGFERAGLVQDPALTDLGNGRSMLPLDSDLFKQGFGPRYAVAKKGTDPFFGP
jgi:hypothetical protein